jgi:hypothetical protein
MNKIKLHCLLIAALFVLIVAHLTIAQSTIVTTPSTDVVSARKVYAEFDFIINFASQHNGGFRSYSPRGVVGVGHHIEVGVNAIYTQGFNAPQPIEIQPNVKYQFYQNEAAGVAAAVGGIFYAPVTHRGGTDTFGMLYTIVSKKVAGKFGPRLTGGGYTLIGRDSGTGARAGAIAAYEQPFLPRTSFVMDWFSGKNRFGYVTPGLSFATSKKSVLYTGYSIGNHGRRNNALFTYYGITF